MSAPEEARELALIDAALAEGRATAADPADRALEEIALAVRDDAPRPDPAFARDVRQRVEEGFAKPRRFRAPKLRLPRARVPLIASAALAIVALAIALAALPGSEDRQTDGTQIAQEPQPPPLEDFAAPPTNGGVAPEATAPGTPATANRRVERSAEMTLAAPLDEMQSLSERVGKVAETHGGYVQSSDISTGDGDAGGTFVLRIPTNRLESALAALGKLGTVTARSESSQDVTAPYRGTRDKLGDLLLERRALKDKLANAEGDERLTLRAQLRELNARIAGVRNRMHDLQQRTVFSTVTVTLEEKSSGGAGAGDDRGGPGGAWDDALGTLEDALAIAIRAIGVAVPLAIIALLGWLGVAVLRRRRREAALM